MIDAAAIELEVWMSEGGLPGYIDGVARVEVLNYTRNRVGEGIMLCERASNKRKKGEAGDGVGKRHFKY